MLITRTQHQVHIVDFASKKVLAPHFQVLEVSGGRGADQGSLKEVCKSSNVTTHQACRVVMRPQGTAGSPQRIANQRLESQHVIQMSPEEFNGCVEEARKRSSDQTRKCSHNHRTTMDIIVLFFEIPKASWELIFESEKHLTFDLEAPEVLF